MILYFCSKAQLPLIGDLWTTAYVRLKSPYDLVNFVWVKVAIDSEGRYYYTQREEYKASVT